MYKNRIQLKERICITVILCAVMLPTANAASVNERLAELGHPNTKMCQLASSGKGLGKLLVVQFKRKKTRNEDQGEAIALLKIMVDALKGSGQRYVGFEATKNWDTCLTRDPDYIYWRDYDDNWRYMRKTPVKYLSKIEADLAPELRGKPPEAFVLFSLGLVEQRLDRIPTSVKRFEEAYDILSRTDDPYGIEALVLIPLIHHHFGEDGDETQGQAYLKAFALVAEDLAIYKGNYLPLIKVAPVYPSKAQRAGREGYVLLEFIVDADGRVQNPVVIEESPKGAFGAAAIEAAKSFRYVPKVVDGVLVPTAGVRNRITFELLQ